MSAPYLHIDLLGEARIAAGGDEEQLQRREDIAACGLTVTGVKDRADFRVIYFREPGGALSEIATDAPGFSVDEPTEMLGTQLKLPPWLEARREAIAARLDPLDPPSTRRD